jgi:Flp pilus assembly protein TadD
MRQQSTRLLASVAMTAILAASLGGCQTMSDITGSISPKSSASAETDSRQAVDVTAERYRADPKNAEAALAYGQALRASGQRSQAAAVLEQATIAHPGDKALLAGYGRALADNGNFQQAFDVLTRAHSPDNPDWRLLSVQGTTLDQLGRHDEARRYYESALKIVPDEPSVLSNLGLSYMLSSRRAGAAEPGAGDRPARPFRRSRADRACRSSRGRGGGQRRLSQADAEPEGRPAPRQCGKNARCFAEPSGVTASHFIRQLKS